MSRALFGPWAVLSAAMTVGFAGAPAHAADDAYLRTCAACHGPELRGGETGPALIGSGFQQHWGAVPPVGLDEYTRRTMPTTAPGSLSDDDYAAALARVRRANGWLVPAVAPPAAGYRKIPATAEWLNNRGDLGSSSYSPLDQINRDNVAKLRIAWRWKSDNFGPVPEYYYRPTPLMADGIVYITAGIRRDVVAIDATTGETLWLYRLDEGERGALAPRRWQPHLHHHAGISAGRARCAQRHAGGLVRQGGNRRSEGGPAAGRRSTE